jgi:hypothetical protein
MLCHSTPALALGDGFGRVNLTARKAAAQASATMATMSASSLRVHDAEVIAVTPIPVRAEWAWAIPIYVTEVTMLRLAGKWLVGRAKLTFNIRCNRSQWPAKARC